MSNELGDYLNSINTTKKDVMLASGAPDAAERLYPSFPITKSLSYAQELVLLVNEINGKGLKQHSLSNRQSYLFFLNVVPKGKRWAKWTKADKTTEDVEHLMKLYKCNREKAADMLEIINLGETQ